MRHYNFKLYEEDDIDLITWLDSFSQRNRERSALIRAALRAYRRKAKPVAAPDRVKQNLDKLGGMF